MFFKTQIQEKLTGQCVLCVDAVSHLLKVQMTMDQAYDLNLFCRKYSTKKRRKSYIASLLWWWEESWIVLLVVAIKLRAIKATSNSHLLCFLNTQLNDFWRENGYSSKAKKRKGRLCSVAIVASFLKTFTSKRGILKQDLLQFLSTFQSILVIYNFFVGHFRRSYQTT